MEKATAITEEDLVLVHRFNETGDRVAIGILFERYAHLVYGVCMKYLQDENDSKDALMQVYEKLLTDLGKHTITNFKGWLYMVAKNHCLMQLRSLKSQDVKKKDYQKEYAASVEIAEEHHLNSNETKEYTLVQLEKGLEELNEEQRVCVKLFYLQSKCYQEIASLTGYDLNQVKSYIQNGKRNLKNYLLTIK